MLISELISIMTKFNGFSSRRILLLRGSCDILKFPSTNEFPAFHKSQGNGPRLKLTSDNPDSYRLVNWSASFMFMSGKAAFFRCNYLFLEKTQRKQTTEYIYQGRFRSWKHSMTDPESEVGVRRV